jgi:glyceraldehyde 3-phosphate dehydrogenase
MTVRVGINGYGRIGRSFHRALLDRGESAGVELVAVNDPFGDSETMAFLLKHDSVGRTIPNEVKVSNGGFSVDGKEIKKLEVREPAEIPWGDHGIEVVIESPATLLPAT